MDGPKNLPKIKDAEIDAESRLVRPDEPRPKAGLASTMQSHPYGLVTKVTYLLFV